jgi:hypothetical protein
VASAFRWIQVKDPRGDVIMDFLLVGVAVAWLDANGRTGHQPAALDFFY